MITDYKDAPPATVGLVFREGLRAAIINQLQERKAIVNGNTVNISSFGTSLSFLIYFDAEQEENCLEFTDRDVLSKYLNRREDPQAWMMVLLGFLEKRYKAASCNPS
ncbi:hypothetical protein [Chroococcidiopsis sp.]|uniref:hypothetical protein n=1 Tax=Chroococcidiopsis sp. TaxID=3088168 RepID=UPI003F3DE4D2